MTSDGYLNPQGHPPMMVRPPGIWVRRVWYGINSWRGEGKSLGLISNSASVEGLGVAGLAFKLGSLTRHT